MTNLSNLPNENATYTLHVNAKRDLGIPAKVQRGVFTIASQIQKQMNLKLIEDVDHSQDQTFLAQVITTSPVSSVKTEPSGVITVETQDSLYTLTPAEGSKA